MALASTRSCVLRQTNTHFTPCATRPSVRRPSSIDRRCHTFACLFLAASSSNTLSVFWRRQHDGTCTYGAFSLLFSLDANHVAVDATRSCTFTPFRLRLRLSPLLESDCFRLPFFHAIRAIRGGFLGFDFLVFAGGFDAEDFCGFAVFQAKELRGWFCSSWCEQSAVLKFTFRCYGGILDCMVARMGGGAVSLKESSGIERWDGGVLLFGVLFFDCALVS
ncbi:hypothetical protein BKA80DRAFT_283031 [Phyllosticta citrichinensis]